jgi:hypothetical protein
MRRLLDFLLILPFAFMVYELIFEADGSRIDVEELYGMDLN